MKLLLSLLLVNLFLFSPYAMAEHKYDKSKRIHAKHKKIKPQKVYKNYPSLEKASEHLELREKVEKQNKSKSIEKKIVKKFKKFLKKLSGQILIEEVDNGKNDILKLRLVDKKSKYQVINVYHRLESLYSERKVTKTYLEGEQTYAEINISEVPVGSFDAYFRFEAIKIKKSKSKEEKDKKSKKEKFKEFLGHGTFEKTQSAFAIFTVDHNPNEGFAYIDTSTSYSEAGDIVEYIYRVYSSGKLIKEETKNYPSNYLTFNELGTNEIELEVVDSAGNRNVSDRQTINIVNSAPTIKYTLTPRDGLVGHYTFDFSGTIDNDGDEQLSYRIFLNYEVDGVVKRALTKNSDNPIIHFAAPAAGVEYNLSFMATDSTGQYDYRRIPFIHNGDIAPKYNWHYLVPYEEDPSVFFVGANYSDDGEIADYIYEAIHEDGTVVQPYDDLDETGFSLPKMGLWTFKFYAIDDKGLQSEVTEESINIQYEPSELAPRFAWRYMEAHEHDPRMYFFDAGFNDFFGGEVVKYRYKATHIDGTVIYPEVPDVRTTEFRFPKKGEWTFEMIAIDDEGFESTPYVFTEYIDWPFDLPSADITLVRKEWTPYQFDVSESRSFPHPVKSYIKATHSSGDILNYVFNDAYFTLQLDKRGSWRVEVVVEDYFGLLSEPQILELEIEEVVLNLNISETSTPRKYLVNSTGSLDPYMPNQGVELKIKATHESGEVIEYRHYPYSSELILSTPGKWNVKVESFDSWSNYTGVYTQTFDIKNELPVARVDHSITDIWNEVAMDAGQSSDDIGVVFYNYKFIHESGHTFTTIRSNSYEQIVLPELEGIWNYDLTLADTDNALSIPTTGTLKIVMPNEAPFADFIFEINHDDYKKVSFESHSHDPENQTLTYEVHLSDGHQVQVKNFSEESFSITLSEGGWSIDIYAIDIKGLKSKEPWHTDLEVYNFHLYASFWVSSSQNPKEISLNALNSYDPDGYIVNYRYKFLHETGTTLEFNTVDQISSFQLSQEGSWNISLEVTDNHGKTSDIYSQYYYLYIPNVRPIASFNCESNIGKLSCDGGSSYDEGGQVKSYVYVLNGKDRFESSESNIEFNFEDYSLVTVELYVVDDKGLYSETIKKSFEVEVEYAPKFSITCEVVIERIGPVTKCSPSFHKELSYPIDSYLWNINGSEFSGSELTFTPQDETIYNIELVVVDTKGQSETSSIDYELKNDGAIDIFDLSSIKFELENYYLNSSLDNLNVHFDPSFYSLENFKLALKLNENDLTEDDYTIQPGKIEISSSKLQNRNVLSLIGEDSSGKVFDEEVIFFSGSKKVSVSSNILTKNYLHSIDFEDYLPQEFDSQISNVPEGKYLLISVSTKDIKLNQIDTSSSVSVQVDHLDQADFLEDIRAIDKWKKYSGELNQYEEYDELLERNVRRGHLVPDANGLAHVYGYTTGVKKKALELSTNVSLNNGGFAAILLKNVTTQKYELEILRESAEYISESISVLSENDVLGAEAYFFNPTIESSQSIGRFLIPTAFAEVTPGPVHGMEIEPNLTNLDFDAVALDTVSIRNKPENVMSYFLDRNYNKNRELQMFSLPGGWGTYKHRQNYSTSLIPINIHGFGEGINPLTIGLNFSSSVDELPVTYKIKLKFSSPHVDDLPDSKIWTSEKNVQYRLIEGVNKLDFGFSGYKLSQFKNYRQVEIFICINTFSEWFETPEYFGNCRKISRKIRTLIPFSNFKLKPYGKGDGELGGDMYVTHEANARLEIFANELAGNQVQALIGDCAKLNGGDFDGHETHGSGEKCDFIFKTNNLNFQKLSWRDRSDEGELIQRSSSVFIQGPTLAKDMKSLINLPSFFNLTNYHNFHVNVTEKLKKKDFQSNELWDFRSKYPCTLVGGCVEGNEETIEHEQEYSVFKKSMENMCLDSGRMFVIGDISNEEEYKRQNNPSLISKNYKVNTKHNNHFHLDFSSSSNLSPISKLNEPVQGIDYDILFNDSNFKIVSKVSDDTEIRILVKENDVVVDLLQLGEDYNMHRFNEKTLHILKVKRDGACSNSKVYLGDHLSLFNFTQTGEFRQRGVKFSIYLPDGFKRLDDFLSRVGFAFEGASIYNSLLSKGGFKFEDFFHDELDQMDIGEIRVIEHHGGDAIYSLKRKWEKVYEIHLKWRFKKEFYSLGSDENGVPYVANVDPFFMEYEFSNNYIYKVNGFMNFGDFKVRNWTNNNFICTSWPQKPFTSIETIDESYPEMAKVGHPLNVKEYQGQHNHFIGGGYYPLGTSLRCFNYHVFTYSPSSFSLEPQGLEAGGEYKICKTGDVRPIDVSCD